jgi:dTDP-glucose 4,6-dehydratase
MRMLVTGGLGFIGSNFILYTAKKHPEFKIVNVDAEFVGSNRQNLSQLRNNRNYQYVKGNICNQKLMDSLISKSDVVFNFAAESHVDRSIANPRAFVDSNIVGTHSILESIRKHKVRLVHISTDEVFGSLKRGSADENHVLNPSSPYSSTKASSELLVKSYWTTYDTDIVITRCTNNFGPRQFPEKLIPKTIILASKDKNIPIFGTGKNVRDWIFVDDHCDAVMTVFKKGKSGESYNIAGHNELSNNYIVRKILKILAKSTKLIKYVSDRPGHDFRYSLDSSKIQKELRWKPRYAFEDGLELTIRWYLENKNWWKNIPDRQMLVGGKNPK